MTTTAKQVRRYIGDDDIRDGRRLSLTEHKMLCEYAALLSEKEARAEMDSLSVGWLEWVEPFGPNNEPVFMRVPYATAIARSKANASANGHTYDNDEQALDDFRAVNWTNECNASSDKARAAIVDRDGEILDWLAHHLAYRLMGSDEKGWSVWDCVNGLVPMSRSLPTYRQAISAAIKKEKGE